MQNLIENLNKTYALYSYSKIASKFNVEKIKKEYKIFSYETFVAL